MKNDLNKALSQLKKLYSDAGLGPLEYVVRNHSSWAAMKQRPSQFADNKNMPKDTKGD